MFQSGRAPDRRRRRSRRRGERVRSQLSSEGVGEPGEATARPRLDRAEGDVEKVGDLALGESGEVGEVDHGSLVLRQRLERPVHAPRVP